MQAFRSTPLFPNKKRLSGRGRGLPGPEQALRREWTLGLPSQWPLWEKWWCHRKCIFRVLACFSCSLSSLGPCPVLFFSSFSCRLPPASLRPFVFSKFITQVHQRPTVTLLPWQHKGFCTLVCAWKIENSWKGGQEWKGEEASVAPLWWVPVGKRQKQIRKEAGEASRKEWGGFETQICNPWHSEC